jgi:5-formyltetrahydrofolate cyclo-ligase
MPWELSLSELESGLRQRGGRLFYPRVKPQTTGELEFFEISDPGDAHTWQKGPYGIEEPREISSAVDPSIGMGQGYYDRFLPRAPQALRVALAYDFQVCHGVPQESWDQPMNWVVTEIREIKK